MPKSNTQPADEWIPEHPTLPRLRRAAEDCRACPLWEGATRAVVGEGPPGAQMALVGEQPGNEEDLVGRPFVGPSGRMLDDCLAEAGIDRATVFVTNTVRHFKFERRGKRRIHQSPGTTEVSACLPWLEAELQVVRPEIVVCLGAVAAKALIGPAVRITRQHGEIFTSRFAEWTMPTYHPSALLRGRDAADRAEKRQIFVADLRRAAEQLASLG